ncbi:Crp/Fnr family transcriptional regulator [Aquibacillus albus]|uniref:CRP-like cAMP-binding protein n=1 Tax=Aquibacillus albus TaxID=1168171 RepID=A0ABS2N5H0_9BACI|nr:cyclic nucleotide-binding domain-containing protein [Aquibacillus albus]MBM7573362.1 CRP-like cAMP-binding protein [Aquibacillus albus]
MKVLSLNLRSHDRTEELVELDGYGVTVNKLQGETIYAPDQVESAAFYLADGYVKLFNQDKGTKKVIGPGAFFGDRSIFYSEDICATALTPIQYIRIEESSFKKLMYHNTKLAMNIITSLSTHVIYLSEKQTILSRIKQFFYGAYHCPKCVVLCRNK